MQCQSQSLVLETCRKLFELLVGNDIRSAFFLLCMMHAICMIYMAYTYIQSFFMLFVAFYTLLIYKWVQFFLLLLHNRNIYIRWQNKHLFMNVFEFISVPYVSF